MESQKMGKKSQQRMTELNLEGRIKRSQRRKAKQEKKRRERQAEATRQLATLILQRSVPPFQGKAPRIAYENTVRRMLDAEEPYRIKREDKNERKNS
jgi:hypothetical protein